LPESHSFLLCITTAKLFLEQLLAALNENFFPQLGEIRFEGFHILEDATPHEADIAGLAGVMQSVRESEIGFANATFTDIKSLSGRGSYYGNEIISGDGRFTEFLTSS
jgi:hypothetical protein